LPGLELQKPRCEWLHSHRDPARVLHDFRLEFQLALVYHFSQVELRFQFDHSVGRLEQHFLVGGDLTVTLFNLVKAGKLEKRLYQAERKNGFQIKKPSRL